MQLQTVLASTLLVFSAFAVAEEVQYVTLTTEVVSYSVVDTVTMTGSPPPNSDQVFAVDQTPLTVIAPEDVDVPEYTGVPSSGMPIPTSNITEPTAPTQPSPTADPTTGAAAGGFGGSVVVVAAVGVLVVLLGSL